MTSASVFDSKYAKIILMGYCFTNKNNLPSVRKKSEHLAQLAVSHLQHNNSIAL